MVVSDGMDLRDIVLGSSSLLEDANGAEHESGRSSPAESVVLGQANPQFGSPSRGGLTRRNINDAAVVSPPVEGPRP